MNPAADHAEIEALLRHQALPGNGAGL
jgi:hypothetical protein